jgi:hypothetical protein
MGVKAARPFGCFQNAPKPELHCRKEKQGLLDMYNILKKAGGQAKLNIFLVENTNI